MFALKYLLYRECLPAETVKIYHVQPSTTTRDADCLLTYDQVKQFCLLTYPHHLIIFFRSFIIHSLIQLTIFYFYCTGKVRDIKV